ncbi:hypothetical protein [Parasphingopyxis lamellibrachiae]|uniref:Uncharacterized protein n=1 Tax=Parasphingopyxis lamellibrachiae TaxID=680125 RepID=A0A3D9FHP1_9SPHN|nr:hypothetical protein [Parasphingopyxis lamellibrachiae]RED16606.1 hypothetical protein DFR46_1632 [Parasphingopyxis lamellibrachiae]
MRTGYKYHRRTSDLRYFLSSLVIFMITFLATIMTLSLASAALASAPTAPDGPGHFKIHLDAEPGNSPDFGDHRSPALLGRNRTDRLSPGSGISLYGRAPESSNFTCSTPLHARLGNMATLSPCGCRPFSIACPLAIDAPAAGARTLPGRHLNPEGDE